MTGDDWQWVGPGNDSVNLSEFQRKYDAALDTAKEIDELTATAISARANAAGAPIWERFHKQVAHFARIQEAAARELAPPERLHFVTHMGTRYAVIARSREDALCQILPLHRYRWMEMIDGTK